MFYTSNAGFMLHCSSLAYFLPDLLKATMFYALVIMGRSLQSGNSMATDISWVSPRYQFVQANGLIDVIRRM